MHARYSGSKQREVDLLEGNGLTLQRGGKRRRERERERKHVSAYASSQTKKRERSIEANTRKIYRYSTQREDLPHP